MHSKTENSLFRRQALENRGAQHYGEMLRAQPVVSQVLALFFVASALTVFGYLYFGEYTRRSVVSGQLVAVEGIATVTAPVTGVVDDINFGENAIVNAGQIILGIDVPRTTVESGETSAALHNQLQQQEIGLHAALAAQQRQLVFQENSIRQQLNAAKQEFQQIEDEINNRKAQLILAEQKLSRLQELRHANFASPLQLNEQQTIVLESKAQMQVLQRQAIGSRRLQAQLQQALHELPNQSETLKANYLRDKAQLKQQKVEIEARARLAVTAPVDGLIATQLVKRGQAVQAGQPLLSLLPGKGNLQAQLIVPSRAIGFIEPGDEVSLRYQAFPYQKFGHHQGVVENISRTALGNDELRVLLGAAQANEPMYRILVNIPQQFVRAYGKEEMLKPGMLLEASIFGEKRRLIEWILEPLYSIQGR